ncbi:MAG TPA: guanylate kinase [Phycisphaerae bacterium]
MPREGKVIVISGPSGAGKTSICEALLKADPTMVWSVSATTRPPRGDEQSGRSYEFIDRAEFERRRAAGEFLETAEYVGHLYGTPLRPVLDAIRSGRDVLMEIDVQGGYQVSRKMPESIRFFVLPPDMESLKARLAGRRTESAEQLQRRLAKADGEIGFARDCGCYQHFVVNDVLDETVAEIREIVRREKQSGEW